MGSRQSVFSQAELDVYHDVTGLNATEVDHAYEKFYNIDPLSFVYDKKGKISFTVVADNIKELKVNPFRYRICQCFCSEPSGLMNFDDFLDMVSVFHPKCPKERKVKWAFKLFDFNDDNVIDDDDISRYLDLVTDYGIDKTLKKDIIKHVLLAADYDGDTAISFEEFERIMFFDPEFYELFRFHL